MDGQQSWHLGGVEHPRLMPGMIEQEALPTPPRCSVHGPSLSR